MELIEYIEIVKGMQQKGLSENLICKILEEHGKDRRTNTMEAGKNKRTSSPQETKVLASEKQINYLKKVWGTEEGKSFLKNIEFKGNFELTKKEAFNLISKCKEKENAN